MTVTLWTEPKVTLIGHSWPVERQLDDLAGGPHYHEWIHTEDGTLMEDLPVFAGRACYQSFGDKAGRRSAEEYLGHIIESQHLSVLEHSSATFYIEGVSRALTHELIRHRHLSYSQLSQRYVDHSTDLGIVIPPAFHADDVYIQQDWYAYGLEVQRDYDTLLGKLADLPIKQRREAARAVLPNCTETKIVVTGNLRAWLEFLGKRDSEHADAEIQRLAKIIHTELKKLAPHVLTD